MTSSLKASLTVSSLSCYGLLEVRRSVTQPHIAGNDNFGTICAIVGHGPNHKIYSKKHISLAVVDDNVLHEGKKMARKRLDRHERNMKNTFTAFSDESGMSLRDVATGYTWQEIQCSKVYFERQKIRPRQGSISGKVEAGLGRFFCRSPPSSGR